MAKEEPLRGDGVDVVHEAVLAGEEALEASAEGATRHHTGLVEVVQSSDHCTQAYIKDIINCNKISAAYVDLENSQTSSIQ